MDEKKDTFKRNVILFVPGIIGILIGYAIILLTDNFILQVLVASIVIILIASIGYKSVKNSKNKVS